MTFHKEYEKLLKQSRRLEHIQGAIQLLDWDQETYMPEGAQDARGDQLKILAGIAHQEKVSSKLAKPLSKLIDLKTGSILATSLTERQKHALKRWRKDYLQELALPKKFVEDFAKLSSSSINAWRASREKNDFKSFLPFLKKIIKANQKKADYLGFIKHPYDALLDLYEPEMTVATISPLFDRLKKGNIALLKKISASPQVDDASLYGNFPVEKQLEFSKELLKNIGYSFNHGRLDLSTHPFSTSPHPTDSRITTRMTPDSVFGCISTVLHEAGHSLYSMGLPVLEFGSPLGQAISMGIHESQSRLWETQIGQSLPFIRYILPLIKKAFPLMDQNVDVLKYYQAVNLVKPSFIRVEADEVSYPLHVILRYELEVALIEGSLNPEELPSAWNAKMTEFLGITPKNNKEGCLQDIHWAMGAFGYFPTYALGNMFAAMLFKAYKKSNPSWQQQIANGEFIQIRSFLHENVYKYGREFSSQELIQKVTGSSFSEKDYTDYLGAKYGEIYK